MAKKKSDFRFIRVNRDGLIRAILSLLYTLLLTTGLLFDSFTYEGTVLNGFLEHSAVLIPLMVLFFFGFYFVSGFLFRRLDGCKAREAEEKKRGGYLKDWVILFGLLLLSALPYLILCFPATYLTFDCYWQILQGTGVFPLSNHHPVLGSLIFGGLYKLGALMGGASGGLFLITVVQLLTACAVMALITASLKWLGVPKGVWVTSQVIFMLCPLFLSHAMWLVKDSFFTSFFCFFCLGVFHRAYARKKGRPLFWFAKYPWIAASGLLSCLYRNGILPIVLLMMGILLWHAFRRHEKKEMQRCLAAMAVLLCLSLLWSGILKWKGIMGTNAREALCMPSRQVVNVLRYYPDALSEEDRTFLEDVYRENGGIEQVVQKYDILRADPVKPSYFRSMGETIRFVGIWMKLGLKHPGAWLDALLEGSYGYWYPLYPAGEVIHGIPLDRKDDTYQTWKKAKMKNMPLYVRMSFSEDGTVPGEKVLDYVMERDPQVAELYDVQSAFPEARDGLMHFMEWLQGVPVLSLLLVPGFYTWLFLFALAYLLARKKFGLLFWPLLLIIALCILAPVNGYMRYFLPVAFLMPLILGSCFLSQEESVPGEVHNG